MKRTVSTVQWMISMKGRDLWWQRWMLLHMCPGDAPIWMYYNKREGQNNTYGGLWPYGLRPTYGYGLWQWYDHNKERKGCGLREADWNDNQTMSTKEDIIDNTKDGMHNDRHGHLHFAGECPGQEECWKDMSVTSPHPWKQSWADQFGGPQSAIEVHPQG